MYLFTLLKDIFSPKRCYHCQGEGVFLCRTCFKKIWFFPSICPICKQTSPDFSLHFYCKQPYFFLDKIIITTHYQEKTIKKLIKDAKFYWKKDILEDLSCLVWEQLLHHISEKKENLLLIPTPMYFWKKLKRWYNQSEVLTKYIATHFWIASDIHIVKKIKSTKPQSHLSKIQRMENLKWAFVLDKKKLLPYKNKTIVLVDDVVSTGSTLQEIAKLLKKAGVKKTYWLCIASD